jgi:drug/metabolite transporter (DMT)-like permease
MEHRPPQVPARWRVPVAFAAVYLIWGSTYLGIRFAVETMPPFLMAGTRFLIAGAILYAATYRRTAPPTRLQWRSAAIVGALLLLGGNGGVVWAEQVVPSSIASLMIATVPLWMALLNWLRGDRLRPTVGVTAGLALGMAGIALLVSQGRASEQHAIDPLGLAVLAGGALSWAVGSLYSRRAPCPGDAFLGTAMQMLAGGGLLLLAGLLTGEAGQLAWQEMSRRSLLSFVYLVLFGSLIGYTAYIWLLRVSTPSKVSTYAFVNPIVAVLLGWGLAGEPLTPRTLAAAAVIVGGVALITLSQPRSASARGIEPRLERGACN